MQVLEEISTKIEEIENALDEVLYLSNTTSTFSVPFVSKHHVSPGRKGISFHAILPAMILEHLRSESIMKALSMNEILCRALMKELKMEE